MNALESRHLPHIHPVLGRAMRGQAEERAHERATAAAYWSMISWIEVAASIAMRVS